MTTARRKAVDRLRRDRTYAARLAVPQVQELHGPLADLILTATGRPAGLANLARSGLPKVTSALA
jgi:hypothetical protein